MTKLPDDGFLDDEFARFREQRLKAEKAAEKGPDADLFFGANRVPEDDDDTRRNRRDARFKAFEQRMKQQQATRQAREAEEQDKRERERKARLARLKAQREERIQRLREKREVEKKRREREVLRAREEQLERAASQAEVERRKVEATDEFAQFRKQQLEAIKTGKLKRKTIKEVVEQQKAQDADPETLFFGTTATQRHQARVIAKEEEHTVDEDVELIRKAEQVRARAQERVRSARRPNAQPERAAGPIQPKVRHRSRTRRLARLSESRRLKRPNTRRVKRNP